MELHHIVGQEVTLFGGINSVGIPFTPDNHLNEGFFEMLESAFANSGVKVESFKFYSLVKNRTWELASIIEKNLSNQNLLKVLKRHFNIAAERMPYPVAEGFAEKYFVSDQESSLGLKDAIVHSNNPIFIYSAGANDAYSYFNISGDPLVAVKSMVLDFDNILDKIVTGIEDNLLYLWNLNPSMQIYVLGPYVGVESIILRKLLAPFYANYELKLKTMLSKYEEAIYVDTKECSNMLADKDVHPNLTGQRYIFRRLYNSIIKYNLSKPTSRTYSKKN